MAEDGEMHQEPDSENPKAGTGDVSSEWCSDHRLEHTLERMASSMQEIEAWCAAQQKSEETSEDGGLHQETGYESWAVDPQKPTKEQLAEMSAQYERMINHYLEERGIVVKSTIDPSAKPTLDERMMAIYEDELKHGVKYVRIVSWQPVAIGISRYCMKVIKIPEVKQQSTTDNTTMPPV